MLKTVIVALVCVVAILACDDPSHQASSRAGEYDPYGSETTYGYENPFMSYYPANYGGYESRAAPRRPSYNPGYGGAEGRLFGLQTNLLGQFQTSLNNALPTNANKPNVNLASFFSGRPPLFSLNPNFPNLLTAFDSCTAPSGESGICTPGKVCTLSGGRPSGACILGGVCCVNVVSACGGTVSLNNTYWQSPNPASTSPSSSTSNSICALNLKLDTNFIEQKQPICQIRLDFVTFNIAQPNTQTVCEVDTFQAGGSLDTVPTICGDNGGQHMYLNVPNSAVTASNLQLFFRFGASAIARSWSIKIAMLPCGADYLAPTGCLQYFTSASGTVSSFNWRDVAGTTTRQLANQNYQVCFRTELISNQGAAQARAGTICYTPCQVTTAISAFSVSAANSNAAGTFATLSAGVSQRLRENCNNDFVVIPGGFNPAVALTDPANALDRYCGERLNPAINSGNSVTVCSSVRPFQFIYRTNGDETTSATVDGNPAAVPISVVNGNLGFCFSYAQRS